MSEGSTFKRSRAWQIGQIASSVTRSLARLRSPLRSTVGVVFAAMATAAILGAAAVAAQAGGGIAVVNSTGDAGDSDLGDGTCSTGVGSECTLRAAIEQANAGSISTIAFNISILDPGHSAGTWTISPATALPQISNTVSINGRTHFAYAGAPVIELDGSNAGSVHGLQFLVSASGSSLHGLSVVDFTAQGVVVSAADVDVSDNYVGLRTDGLTRGPNLNGVVLTGNAQNVTIRDNVLSGNSGSGIVLVGSAVKMNFIDGNMIGTTPDGTAAPGSGPAGISIIDASDNVIGKAAPNIISGNAGDGIVIRGSSGNAIVNNVIGASVTGAPLKNGWSGIQLLDGATNVTIGEVGSGNAIVANDRNGIQVTDAGLVAIDGNFIGTDPLGVTGLGNRWRGILVETQSSDVRIADNTIAANGQEGLAVASDTAGTVSIVANTFSANGGIGIDLEADGPTQNDEDDADLGVNGLLNYPEILATLQGPGNTFTVHYLVSAPAGEYVARIYTNPSGVDPSGFGEGEVIATSQLIDHPGGLATYLTTQAFAGVNGDLITAHLQETGDGPASEFSQPFIVSNLIADPTVNSTDDDPDSNPGDGLCFTGQLNSELAPECTLRAAIQEANADSNRTVIDFDIPISDSGRRTVGTDDVWRISIPDLQLPSITAPVEIDGASQPGFTSQPVIEVDGIAVSRALDGLVFAPGAEGSVLRNLALANFGDNAVEVRADGVQIQSNWFGTLRGIQPGLSNGTGVAVVGSPNGVEIGGAMSSQGNLFLSNDNEAILISGSQIQNTLVRHNQLGDGSVAPPNGIGINVSDARDTTIQQNAVTGSDTVGIRLAGADVVDLYSNWIASSGTDNIFVTAGSNDITIGMIDMAGASFGNTVATAGDDQIQLEGAGPNIIIEGNNIGQLPNGTPAGGADDGINIGAMSNAVTIRDNIIVNNADRGINVRETVTGPVTISENSIADNGTIAIDRNNDGPTSNNLPDGVLNKPEILNVTNVGADVFEVEFLIPTQPGDYVLELFESPNVYPAGHGDAAAFVTGMTVTGPAPFVLQASGDVGNYFSATLTDVMTGETSEVSDGVILPPHNLPPELTVPGPQTSFEGNGAAIALSASDPEGDPLMWTVSGLPDGLSFSPVTNQIDGTLTFASAGTHVVTVAVDDGINPPVSGNFVWTVADVNRPPLLMVPGIQIDDEGDTVGLTLTAADPDDDPLTWTVSGLPDGLSFSPVTNQIDGTLSFASAGTHVVTVAVDDGINPPVTADIPWTVVDTVLTTTTTTTTTTPPATSTTTTTSAAPSTTTTSAAPNTTTAPAARSTTTAVPRTTTTATPPTIPSENQAPTTTAAPRTTSTTGPSSVPPTTTASPVSAPTTATNSVAAPTTTTEAAAPIPEAIPFTVIVATDDSVVALGTEVIVDVLENDSFGDPPQLSVTQPSVGSVKVRGNAVVVNVPPSFSGEVVFTYTIRDSAGGESTAEVQVLSSNVLAPTQGTLTLGSAPIGSAGEAFDRAAQLFTGLVRIRLTSLQLGVLALAPPIFGLIALRFRRREDLVSITRTSRTRTVDVPLGSDGFSLRHNALVWSSRRTRQGRNGATETRITLPNGAECWVDSNLITDTGF